MRYGKWVLCGLALAMVDSLSAATLIEQTDGEEISVMYVEGAMLRSAVGGATDEGYALMNLAERTFFMVNPAEKTVLDMSSIIWKEQPAAHGEAAAIEASMEKVGAGPRIAGYETVHYTLMANGKKCQELYLSREAFDDSGFASVWADHAKNLREMDVDPNDPCDLAEQQTLDYGKYGWPLKIVHVGSQHAGQFEEVQRVEKGAQVPAGGFEVPAGYEMVSFETMMGGYMDQAMDDGDEWEEDDFDEETYDEEPYAGESFDEEQYPEEEGGEDLGEQLKGFMDRFNKDD